MRALVYPYNDEFAPFIEFGKCTENIEIVETLSPSGWGLPEKTVFEEIANKSDIDKVNWENIDVLLLIDSGMLILSDSDLLFAISYAAKKGKRIIVNRQLNEVIFLRITSICNEEHTELVDLRKDIQGEILLDKRIKEIDTPVILVAGMGEKCDKFSVQIFLKSYYENLDYKVCAISSRTNTELYGMHSFPAFMYGNKLDEATKIVNFNHYVKNIEKEERPDIIIIGIPGGIMPVSDKHPEHFGVFAFEIFNAVKGDVLLFCLHNNSYTKDYFYEVQNLCEYRFDSNIDAFVIANHAYDSFSLETEGQLKYLSFDNEAVEQYVSQYPDNVYMRLTYEKLAERILDILGQYGENQII